MPGLHPQSGYVCGHLGNRRRESETGCAEKQLRERQRATLRSRGRVRDKRRVSAETGGSTTENTPEARGGRLPFPLARTSFEIP